MNKQISSVTVACQPLLFYNLEKRIGKKGYELYLISKDIFSSFAFYFRKEGKLRCFGIENLEIRVKKSSGCDEKEFNLCLKMARAYHKSLGHFIKEVKQIKIPLEIAAALNQRIKHFEVERARSNKQRYYSGRLKKLRSFKKKVVKDTKSLLALLKAEERIINHRALKSTPLYAKINELVSSSYELCAQKHEHSERILLGLGLFYSACGKKTGILTLNKRMACPFDRTYSDLLSFSSAPSSLLTFTTNIEGLNLFLEFINKDYRPKIYRSTT